MPKDKAIWVKAMGVVGHSPTDFKKTGKITDVDMKAFTRQVKAGAFGDPAKVMARIQAETGGPERGLDLRRLYEDDPPDEPKPTPSSAMVRASKLSAQAEKDEAKARVALNSALDTLVSLGVTDLTGAKNVPSASKSTVEDIVAFAKSVREKNITTDLSHIQPMPLKETNKALRELIKAARAVQEAQRLSKQAQQEAVQAANPFSGGTPAPATPDTDYKDPRAVDLPLPTRGIGAPTDVRVRRKGTFWDDKTPPKRRPF